MKQILIENDRRVDIARSDQQVADLANHGWTVVADLPDLTWGEVRAKAWEYAGQTGKHCDVRKPLNKEEKTQLLARVYHRILSWQDNDEESGEANNTEKQQDAQTE